MNLPFSMPCLTLMVGPPGSGKSTYAKTLVEQGFVYANQDLQGRGYLDVLEKAVAEGKNVVVDRMNFDKKQRSQLISLARPSGYGVQIVVLHESQQTCFDRMIKRENHPTIKDEISARKALNTFFSKYERVEDIEADIVKRIWPEGEKPKAIVCDLDGTLCNLDHRLHHVRKVDGKKANWGAFFAELDKDTPNTWCSMVLRSISHTYGTQIVYCSGRPDSYRNATREWLTKHDLNGFFDPITTEKPEAPLYMRNRSDFRDDTIAKEILLDFEILTRFTPQFMIDDRQRVVDTWRRRGYTCLQCAPGDF